MSNSCSFRCKHCNQQFSQKAVYQEATVVLCPHCSKMFIPSLWHYLRKEWIEPISVAIVLALFIKRVIFEIYVIPTSSMEPTLHGGGNYPEDGGDKVLVNKFVYHFTEPKNWDVIVFDPPRSNHLFIKRLIGLPNQVIQLVNGDIYADGRILRKPKIVEDSMLYCLYDSTQSESHLNHFYQFEKEAWEISENWRISENHFSINKASGDLKFAYPIDMRIESHKNTNLQVKHGLFEHRDRKNGRSQTHHDDSYSNLKVGDIRVEGKLKINDVAGVWQIVIFENEDVFKLLLNLDNNKAEVYKNTEMVWSSSVALSASNEYRFSFSNVDDKLSGLIAGVEFEYLYVNENLAKETHSNGFEFKAKDCNLEMSDIKVSRDIHYLLGDNNSAESTEKVVNSNSENTYPTYKPGSDDFFCLGDNVLDSQDSRAWGFAKGSKIKGQAIFVLMPIRIWPGNDLPPQIPFLTHRTRFKKIH